MTPRPTADRTGPFDATRGVTMSSRTESGER
jgi:hypothetical protein